MEPKSKAEGENSSKRLEVDVKIYNIMCTFNVGCKLNLKDIATLCDNVELKKERQMVLMKIRHPKSSASIFSSGKVTMIGTTSGFEAKIAARRCARMLQKMNPDVKFIKYRIVNMFATCTMPFAINIAKMSEAHPQIIRYEPKVNPFAMYRLEEIATSVKIFSTGSVTVTSSSTKNIQTALEKTYRLVCAYGKERLLDEEYPAKARKPKAGRK